MQSYKKFIANFTEDFPRPFPCPAPPSLHSGTPDAGQPRRGRENNPANRGRIIGKKQSKYSQKM